jgi:glycosyltransferase involved in cell wall biosynthesis
MDNKAAIGILLNSLDMGGAEKQSLLQAKLMAKEYDVHFIVQRKKPQLKQHLDFIERENINYVQLSGNFIIRLFQLSDYIKKNRIKILFAYLTLDNLLASVVSVFQKIKVVGGVRSSALPAVKFYVTLILQKYFLDYMIFNNHFGREVFIKKGFSQSKSLVIHNCINNIQKELIRPQREKIRILSVGRFTRDKDYLTALKTILLLKSRIIEYGIEYIIVGDGELFQQIYSWIDELKLSDVTVIRNPEDIGNYYLQADIYFISSVSEGMPNTIMEALNYSLPVVSTDVGDAGYLVKDGVNGFLVPAGDSNRLAEKLSELVSDPIKRKSFGLNGHSLLIKEFSESKFSEEYINFTRRII